MLLLYVDVCVYICINSIMFWIFAHCLSHGKYMKHELEFPIILIYVCAIIYSISVTIRKLSF